MSPYVLCWTGNGTVHLDLAYWATSIATWVCQILLAECDFACTPDDAHRPLQCHCAQLGRPGKVVHVQTPTAVPSSAAYSRCAKPADICCQLSDYLSLHCGDCLQLRAHLMPSRCSATAHSLARCARSAYVLTTMGPSTVLLMISWSGCQRAAYSRTYRTDTAQQHLPQVCVWGV
jgi:hypothetical protein